MKIIIESAAYLIIMALICLVGIDFVSMNMGVSHVGEVEQYIEDYIEIYGEVKSDDSLEQTVVAGVEKIASENKMKFHYEYETKTEKYAYYRIHMTYALQSRVFHLGKTHTYEGLVRVEL